MRFSDHPLHVVSFALLTLAVLLLSACSPAGTTPDDTDTIACTEDAFQCPDGNWVGRTGPDCAFVCPQPGPSYKEYVGTSTEMCMRIKYTCDGDEMFSDDRGCGCLRTRNEAAVTLCTADYTPVCATLADGSRTTAGNRCQASVLPTVVAVVPGECPGDANALPADAVPVEFKGAEIACTMQYDPVCAYYNASVQCVTWPCAITLGNACAAQTVENIAYYVPGECPTPGSSGGREYVSRDQTRCAATTWVCAEGMQQFYDETGCGCEPAVREPETAVEACPAERSEACTREYSPVCGIGPDGTAQEYANRCTACADESVTGTYVGDCSLMSAKPRPTTCTDPRPEMCTMDYRPVCATRADGSRFTAGNACGACGDRDVVSHVPGECPETATPEKVPAFDCPATRTQACTKEYMPVCGQKDDGTSSTYGNKCTACADSDVLSYTEGACA